MLLSIYYFAKGFLKGFGAADVVEVGAVSNGAVVVVLVVGILIVEWQAI